ncbi:asparagine synthetase B family protein [Flavobacterium filum]|uniref:asparagine synthase-related protein n=1 Tax=Flavobacterium filum TaxID=370974 RepID=UPI0003F9DDDB|nr:asparagine synthetase B family protein [Flavobacterium filum]
MKEIKTAIIPVKTDFVGLKSEIDHKAICIFAATGFFLDDDTYFVNQKALRPATNYTLSDDSNSIIKEENYFKWHYSPFERPFDQIVEEFTVLFEKIINEQVQDKKVILPLSGGLDSRTQAAALRHLNKKVHAYSYEFENGHNETKYAEQIAKVCDFPFEKWIIPKGYLWKDIEEIASINQCYTEFTHPRQAAVLNKLAGLGEVISLGHWGDVLFDNMDLPSQLSIDEQVDIMIKKVIKKSGIEFAEKLWKSWDLEGDFYSYFRQRIKKLLEEVTISEEANAQTRAFKSLYWASRWTGSNLSFFEKVKPITLPYYDERMLQFICSVPERFLAKRQIQIAYLKKQNPQLAKITWQDQRPFNLYSHQWNYFPWNFPYRVYQKIRKDYVVKNKVRNNYENQFLGNENEIELRKWLFENQKFKAFLDPKLVEEMYDGFINENHLSYSHVISTLLTLSLFTKISE